MTIAIDFDGVICKRIGIPTKSGWSECVPVEGALDSIKWFLKLGCEIYVLTSNPDPDGVYEWLKDNNFPHLEVTNIKKPATIYIDDRAIRFTNWQDIRKYIA